MLKTLIEKDKQYEWIVDYGGPLIYGMYSTELTGYNITDWQWWAVLIPGVVIYTFIINHLRKYLRKKVEKNDQTSI